ncbi:uncharacterized protein LOC128964325 [Oppia nitens]|uniref:uncharacterized protein LOC128964325 n=1 Tax=Oppia nitens TaxID=1686743 RepID=UPI0023DBEED2|nr:uncharacterized protein LOC128964325 [Oppia nitens]
MAKTLICIHFTRTLLAVVILLFNLVSILKLFNFPYTPSPDYSLVVLVLINMILVLGLISAATQHLKTLILFGWIMALTVLLIFFGNTVSSQYQSDLWGMLYMLCITIIAFADAICVIKYRMPKEQMACHQQQHYHHNQQSQHQSTPPPPPQPPPVSSQTPYQQQVFDVPPPPLSVNQYYASKSDPQFHAV